MGFKCVTQIMALVRGDGMRRDGKGQAKHRANAGAIIGEAFEISDPEDGHPIPIRKSASETYDKARTVNNRYEGYRYQTADDVIAALEEAADAHKVPVERKSRKTGKVETHYRALPPDAVIGIAVIHKPPCAVARTWTPEQYEKYIKDSREVMELIQCGGQTVKGSDEFKRGREPCRLFAQKNRIASAMHWDEGSEDNEDLPEEEGTIYAGHWHDIFIPEDENGLYRGNLIDAYFLSHVSAVYPAMMRERGWDIDECDCTRWDLFAQDKDYREERKRKIKEGGRSVNKHRERMRRKKTDAKLEEAQGILDQAIETKRDVEGYAERTRQEAEAEAERIVAGAKKEKADIETDIANLAKERIQAVRDRDTAKGGAAGRRAGP